MVDSKGQQASPLAISLAVGVIVLAITGSIPGGFSAGTGFVVGVITSLIVIYGAIFLTVYWRQRRAKYEGDGVEYRNDAEVRLRSLNGAEGGELAGASSIGPGNTIILHPSPSERTTTIVSFAPSSIEARYLTLQVPSSAEEIWVEISARTKKMRDPEKED